MAEPPYYVRNRTIGSMQAAILRLMRAAQGPPDLTSDVLDTLSDQDLAKLIADAQAVIEARKRLRSDPRVKIVEVNNLLAPGPRRTRKPAT